MFAMMPKDLKDLLRAFNEHNVKYVIVGGYAFGVYAEPRATKDLDVFIQTEVQNSEAVFKALAAYGAPLDGFSPEDFRDLSTFQIGQPPARVDIIQQISGVSFEQAWANRIEGVIDGEVPAGVISREDLIQNKLASGREQDLLDVKVIRATGSSTSTTEAD
jgi:predicted nucleotidyltransferase